MLSATPGTLVAATAKPYRFADSQTGQIKEGTSYRLYLVTDFDTAPIELKADAAIYTEAAGYGMGSKIEALIEISARDNRVLYTARSINLASANGVKARA